MNILTKYEQLIIYDHGYPMQMEGRTNHKYRKTSHFFIKKKSIGTEYDLYIIPEDIKYKVQLTLIVTFCNKVEITL